MRLLDEAIHTETHDVTVAETKLKTSSEILGNFSAKESIIPPDEKTIVEETRFSVGVVVSIVACDPDMRR